MNYLSCWNYRLLLYKRQSHFFQLHSIQKKIIIKRQASNLLTPTDWYAIKAIDVESYSVPSSVTTFKADVRTTSNEMEDKIDACTTVDELAALYVYTDGSRPLGEFPTLEI